MRIVVDMRRELPERWKTMCERAGIPGSARGIAAAAELAITTVQRLVFEGRTSQATIEAVAGALRVDETTVMEAAGIAPDKPLWRPPSEAQELGPRTQEALSRLILAMAEEVSNAGRQSKAEKSNEQGPERTKGGGDDGRSEARKSGLTWQERRRQRMIEQAMNVEEAADMHPLQADFEVADEDVSQDPDDWGQD